MSRTLAASILAVAASLLGCASPPAQTTHASSPPVAPIEVKPSIDRCPSPSSIFARDPKDAKALLADDPIEVPRGWKRGEGDLSDSVTASNGARFDLVESGKPPSGAPTFDVVASKDGKELWRAKGSMIAGGMMSIALSPMETIVSRSFSRGTTELFEASTGRRLGVVGNDALVSPDDRFVLDLPTIVFGVEQLTHREVIAIAPTSGKAKTIARMADGSDTRFGAAICSTGATFALARDGGELQIFRASDLALLAAIADPGPGNPAFSRSGRYVVMGADEDGPPTRLFELR